jgi:hypothetical protein
MLDFFSTSKTVEKNLIAVKKHVGKYSYNYASVRFVALDPDRMARLGEFSSIGRLLPFWQFFNYRRSPNIWTIFFHGKISVLCKFGM